MSDGKRSLSAGSERSINVDGGRTWTMYGCPCCVKRRQAPGVPLSAQDSDSSGVTSSASSSLAAELMEERAARWVWIDELYAAGLNRMTVGYEAKAGGYKEALFGQLKEKSEKVVLERGEPLQILELGIGTGPNLKFYASPYVQVTGIDPSKASDKYVYEAAKSAGLAQEQFKFIQAVGEGIPLPDKSVDVVLSSLVLCSVTDLEKTLAEVHRVLRPGGQYLFMEHVAAPAGTNIRWWQDLLKPGWQVLFDGCQLNREPRPLLQGAGFNVEAEDVQLSGWFFALLPHLIGRGTKSAL